MVVTRKQAAEPSSSISTSSSDVAVDSTPQSNLNLLASSASNIASCPSSKASAITEIPSKSTTRSTPAETLPKSVARSALTETLPISITRSALTETVPNFTTRSTSTDTLPMPTTRSTLTESDTVPKTIKRSLLPGIPPKTTVKYLLIEPPPKTTAIASLSDTPSKSQLRLAATETQLKSTERSAFTVTLPESVIKPAVTEFLTKSTEIHKPGSEVAPNAVQANTVKWVVSSKLLPDAMKGSDATVAAGMTAGKSLPTTESDQSQSAALIDGKRWLSSTNQNQSAQIKLASLLPQQAQSSGTMEVLGSSSHHAQLKTAQSTSSLLVGGSTNSGEKPPPVMQYKIVFQNTPALAPTGQQSVISSCTPGLLSSQTSTASAASAIPTAYTICSASGKDGGATQTVLVPVAQPSQLLPGTTLMTPSSIVKPINSKSGILVESSGSLVACSTISVTMTSPPALVNISRAANNVSLKGTITNTISSLPVQPNTSVLAPSTSISQSSVSNPVSQTLYLLANTAKADMTSMSEVTSSADPAGESPFTLTELPGSVPDATSATEGETVSWDRTSTLKLIELYKEHRAYLNDPHFKKKSVWELMATKLRQSRADGPPFRWNHVENKWKNMTKKYRDCIDMNHRNGTSLKCNFYDEIAEIYKYSPDEDRRKAAEGLRALKTAPRKENGHTEPTPNSDSDFIFGNNTKLSIKVDKSKPEEATHKRELGTEVEAVLVKKKKYAHLDTQRTSASSISVTRRPILPQPMQPQVHPSVDGGTESESNHSDVIHILNQLRADRAKQDKVRMDRLEQMHKEKMAMFSQFLDILKHSKQ